MHTSIRDTLGDPLEVEQHTHSSENQPSGNVYRLFDQHNDQLLHCTWCMMKRKMPCKSASKAFTKDGIWLQKALGFVSNCTSTKRSDYQYTNSH